VAFWPSPVTVPPSDASEGVVYKEVLPHLTVTDQHASMQVQAPAGPLGIKLGELHGSDLTNLSDHLEPQAKRVKLNKGGRPARHNWDSFWIEIAWYAAKHDLEAVDDRQKLQRHMVEWTSENWESAPDEATIRSKIRELFQARNRA
jgi:hypothetical protein